MNELQDLVESTWEEYRARYHAMLSRSTNGEDGSMGSDGAGILQVRSGSQRIAQSLLSVTELLNGSGDLPDASALLSSAVSTGQSVEDFTCMVLSLMFLMDGIFLMNSGRKDTVAQMCENFMNGKEPQSTAESTPLKMRTPEATTPSPAPVDASKVGRDPEKDSTKPSPPLKKGKLVKGSGRPSTSRSAKATPKK